MDTDTKQDEAPAAAPDEKEKPARKPRKSTGRKKSTRKPAARKPKSETSSPRSNVARCADDDCGAQVTEQVTVNSTIENVCVNGHVQRP